MEKLTNSKIEEISVNKIENLCANFPKLESHIEKNDRTSSVDGKIIVRKQATEKKEDILDYITVQVKGTQVQELSESQISFDADVADLKNFDLCDGIIFFVVEIVSNDKYRIFYNSLLPYDITDILNKTKERQKQKRIKLRELDESQFFDICSRFVTERKNQKGIKCIPNEDAEKLENYRVTFTGNMIEYMLADYVYVKAYQKEIKENIIAQKASIFQINEHNPVEVYVGDEKYYDEVVVQHNKTEKSIRIGKSLFISKTEKNSIPKIDINIQGNLYERIKDIKFLIALNLNKRFYVEDSFFEIIPNEKSLKCLREILKELEDIFAMFECLGVTFDVDLDKLSQKDKETIAALVDAVIYNKGTIRQSNKIEATNIAIADKKIAILLFEINDVKRVYNYFDLHKHSKFKIEADDGKEYQVPCYNDIKAELWLQFCNFNLNSVKESILQCEISSEAMNISILMYLEMLKCYDITKNEAYLKICEDTICFLKNIYPNELTIAINYYQTIKRSRDLTMEEKECLILQKEGINGDVLALCCINVILENKSDYEYFYGRLTDEEKRGFSKWPIYNLVQNYKW